MDNIQHLLDKVRSPRVQITYDVETNGAKVIKELPYIVTVITNIIGDSEKVINYYNRQFINLKPDNFNDVMDFLGVKLNLNINKYSKEPIETPEKIDLSLFFKNIHDFHPDNIINNWDVLSSLKKKLILFKDLKRKITSNNVSMESLLTAIKNGTLNSSMMKTNEEKKDKTSEKEDHKKKGK